jgi:hypothetical protein
MSGLVIVKDNIVIAGSPDNKLTKSSNGMKRILNSEGGKLYTAIKTCETIEDTGLYTYGPVEITIESDKVIYNYPIIERPHDQCVCCLSKRARNVRDCLVNKIQSMIDNWTRRVAIATRNGEDITVLESQLVDLQNFQQALCDVPQQAGFPDTFDWPTISGGWESVTISGVNIADYYNDKIAHWSEPLE